jgi:hypothetical protein
VAIMTLLYVSEHPPTHGFGPSAPPSGFQFHRGHNIFVLPDNTTLYLWRYMDLAKFLALLQTRKLVLSRLDLFEDKFEGVMSAAAIQAVYADPNIPAEAKTILIDSHQISRKRFYVQCWHQNNFESAAMWKLYGSGYNTIAIQTDLESILSVIGEQAYFGMVNYMDYNSDINLYHSNSFSPVLCKRHHFSHEREYRIVAADFSPDHPEKPRIMEINIDINKLIKRILVPPETPDWYFNTIVDVAKKYDIWADVSKSDI